MLEFAPFNEFTAMLLSERTEAAAVQLVRSIGFDAMRQATERLQMEGLISEDCAAHIILRLMGDLSIGQEQVQRMERLGIDVPDELVRPEAAPALQAIFTRTGIHVTTDVGDGHEHAADTDEEQRAERIGRLERMERLRAAKRKVDGQEPGDGPGHTCPICGEPISRQAIGCRKHWRQVKEAQKDG